MLKFIYCVLLCVFLRSVLCLQIPSYVLEDERYLDVQRVPLNAVKGENDFSRIQKLDVSTIGRQCVFCNVLLFNKIRGNNWSSDCAYYTVERCLEYFESYSNDNEKEKINKHKRFDEIDKTAPGFRVLNQI